MILYVCLLLPRWFRVTLKHAFQTIMVKTVFGRNQETFRCDLVFYTVDEEIKEPKKLSGVPRVKSDCISSRFILWEAMSKTKYCRLQMSKDLLPSKFLGWLRHWYTNVQDQEVLSHKVGGPGGQRYCEKDICILSVVIVPRISGIHSGRVSGMAVV